MEPSEQKALDHVTLRLQRKFPQTSPEAIRREVEVAYREVRHSRVRTYLPILVERQVSDRLTHHHPAAS
jgi:hypothetical protein